jgi:CDP-paratose 2-epimerase
MANSVKKLLVTGSSGLIGSEVCLFFANLGWEIHGVDNNQRAVFFWKPGRYTLEPKPPAGTFGRFVSPS